MADTRQRFIMAVFADNIEPFRDVMLAEHAHEEMGKVIADLEAPDQPPHGRITMTPDVYCVTRHNADELFDTLPEGFSGKVMEFYFQSRDGTVSTVGFDGANFTMALRDALKMLSAPQAPHVIMSMQPEGIFVYPANAKTMDGGDFDWKDFALAPYPVNGAEGQSLVWKDAH